MARKLIENTDDMVNTEEKISFDGLTITGNYSDHDTSNPVSKTSYQVPQDNKQERGISNQVGYPREKLYRDLL